MSPLHAQWTNLIALERELDPMFRARRSEPQLTPSLQATMREWSQAVWTVAETQGPSVIGPEELEHGLRLAARPVFVCGAARSGTTLLRDLLDSHSQLAVVPTESLFFTFLERALFDLRADRHSAYLGRRWLERLIAPPPHWLLGSSATGASPYVAFARDFAAWWQVPEQHRETRISCWPLAALALAYAQRLGGGRIPPAARMWVEKTPGSERFLDRIWHEFPAAKVIHIVRRPEAVLASIKRMKPERWNHRGAIVHVVRKMAPSYRIAADRERRLPEERYCLIRYEDLTADPEAVMRLVAGFLGIDPHASLSLPTVAGRPAASNSSFETARPDPVGVLEPVERALLRIALGRAATRLGYGELLSPGKHRVVAGLTQGQRADAAAADRIPSHVQAPAPSDRLR